MKTRYNCKRKVFRLYKKLSNFVSFSDFTTLGINRIHNVVRPVVFNLGARPSVGRLAIFWRSREFLINHVKSNLLLLLSS